MVAPLPIATAPFLEAIAAPLLECGAPVERFLDRCAIPATLLERHEGVLSELALWEFEELSARTEGIDSLGYVAAVSVPGRETGSFCRVPLPNTRYLYQLLGRLCRQISNHSNYANHKLEWTESGAWYVFDNRKLVARLPWQVEQFIVGMIVAIARTAYPAWKPPRLSLTNDRAGVHVHPDWQGAQIHWSQQVTGVFVEHQVLFRSAGVGPEAFFRHADVSSDHALLDLVAAYVMAHNATLEKIADAFRVTPRTLQRALADRGLRFRELKIAATMMLATKLLDDETQAIGDVARMLGYADHADFTHAFKRQKGMSPYAWRMARAMPLV